MFESGPASAVSKPSTAPEMMGRGMPRRVLRPVALLPIRDWDVDHLIAWGNFPRKLRRLYIAQNGKCPYCGHQIPMLPSPSKWQRAEPGDRHPTKDHVNPRRPPDGPGDTLRIGNRVVACLWCNKEKGCRPPRPCEVLFAEITGELVIAMLPPERRMNYLRSHLTSQKEPANVERI